MVDGEFALPRIHAIHGRILGDGAVAWNLSMTSVSQLASKSSPAQGGPIGVLGYFENQERGRNQLDGCDVRNASTNDRGNVSRSQAAKQNQLRGRLPRPPGINRRTGKSLEMTSFAPHPIDSSASSVLRSQYQHSTHLWAVTPLQAFVTPRSLSPK